MRFTNESIRDAAYQGDGKRPHLIWDSGTSASVSGLGVRIYPPDEKGKSSKTFVLGYRFPNKLGKIQKRYDKIGPLGEMTVTEARGEARDWKEDIRKGTDPRVSRNRDGAEVEFVTFGHVVEQFIEKYAKPRQKTWKDTERILKVDCAAWWGRPIKDISKTDAYTLIEGFKADGHESKARKAHAWLKTLFGWAVKRDYLEASIMAALDIEFERSVTDRHYSDDEVKAIWAGADKLDDPKEAAFTKLCLLLSVRKNELAGMRDSEFDDADKPTLWTVPNERTKSRKRKTERVYLVPLPKLAQRIIKGMPRNDDGMLFPGRLKDKAINPGNTLQKKIRKATGVEDYAFHPCRDTVASWLKDEGHNTYERALVLNHAEGGVTADYSHGYPVELKRELLEKWAAHVERLVQPEGVTVLR